MYFFNIVNICIYKTIKIVKFYRKFLNIKVCLFFTQTKCLLFYLWLPYDDIWKLKIVHLPDQSSLFHSGLDFYIPVTSIAPNFS